MASALNAAAILALAKEGLNAINELAPLVRETVILWMSLINPKPQPPTNAANSDTVALTQVHVACSF
jgi:hypothetical protein